MGPQKDFITPRHLFPLDIPVILLSVLAAVFSLAAAASPQGKAAVLVVTAPSGEWRFSLDRDLTERIPGALGESVIAIEDGRARFTESPCQNKLCVLHSPLGTGGAWSACLPNQVMLRVEGADAPEIDVMTD